MDFWVFVAAASAGCLTKYLKNTPRDIRKCKPTFSGNCHVDVVAHGKKTNKGSAISQDSAFDRELLGIASTKEVASTSGLDETIARDLEDYNLLSIASMPMEYTVNNTYAERENESTSDCDICSGSGNMGTEKFDGRNCSFQCAVKSSSSLRSRYQHLQPRPLNSLESCLMAQLYSCHAEWEDHTRSLHRLATSSMVRPLVVTDGSNIISRRSESFVRVQAVTESNSMQNRSYIAKNRNVIGIPPLPRPKRLQNKIRRVGKSGTSRAVSGRKFSTQHGSIHGMIIFSLGVYMGIISSAAGKKREVDKLKELLKQTENLVQDLQEELEMKDSLIVKELANEIYGSQDTHQASFLDAASSPFSCEQREGDVSKEAHNPKTGESTDSMSKIEAELEAELERLGLNVGLSNAQLNNIMADFPKGELIAPAGENVSEKNRTKDGSSSTSTTQSINYAVSPRALTLRLHEVIQSRLEERIQELELALENSQRKVRVLESSRKRSASRQFLNDMAQPLVMNLSSEALSAYDEAYEEFTKFDSSEEDSPSCCHTSLGRGAETNGITQKIVGADGRISVEPFLPRGAKETSGTLFGAQEIDSFGMSRDESSDADDEMLIRQLVERTKRGSPVIIKAQRLLFSDQEDPH